MGNAGVRVCSSMLAVTSCVCDAHVHASVHQLPKPAP